MSERANVSALTSLAMKAGSRANSLSTELTWVDMIKGMAIIGIMLENWINYMRVDPAPGPVNSLLTVFASLSGSTVQVFFVLSGFGLTLAYLKLGRRNWSWQQWAWRRFTKIVVPYEIIVVLSFMLGILGSYLYESVDMQFSWTSLLAYMTFTRALFPESWIWNGPLWFMPIIIGLYVSFPVLIRLLEKLGPWSLLSISLVITYGTLTVGALAGYDGDHDSALFTYWILPFALGMLLAYQRQRSQKSIRFLLGPIPLILGIVLTIGSWALRTYVPLGRAFNDSITAPGVFLLLLNSAWIMRALLPAVGRALLALSSRSFIMYLVHYPIMLFLIGPLLRVRMNPLVLVFLGGVYILAVYLLCYFLYRPMNRLSSRLYALVTS